MSTHAEQALLNIIYKEVQKFNRMAFCVKADVVRVAPDLWVELLSTMVDGNVLNRYAIDYHDGRRHIFGIQVEQEPYFPSMTFRIEGGCGHHWHELEREEA